MNWGAHVRKVLCLAVKVILVVIVEVALKYLNCQVENQTFKRVRCSLRITCPLPPAGAFPPVEPSGNLENIMNDLIVFNLMAVDGKEQPG